MSFLDGILSVGKSAVGFLSGNSVASSLVKLAGMGLIASQLAKNANKSNDIPSSGTTPPNIDQGVRLQIPPAADKKIPVLYGTAFFGGNITDAAMTNNNKTMWYCITLSEKTGTKLSDGQASDYVFKDVYWNDQRIVFKSDGITVDYTVDRNGILDRSLGNQVFIYCYKGGSSAGVLPENYSGTAPAAAYTLMPNWTTAHTMDNLIFALVRVDYNREKSVTGLGTVLFHIQNSMSLPGDVVFDYMTNTRYGAGIAAAEVYTA